LWSSLSAARNLAVSSDGMQVILIDDSDIDNKVNTKLLKLARLTSDIVAFTDPMQAFAYVEKEGATWTAPRWIMLDIQMPGTDGFAWLEKFRTLPEGVQSMCRIYMLSASIDREELKQAEHDPSVIALMEKPLDVYMFRQLLDL
jgi:CheY-like chemotaxis protein